MEDIERIAEEHAEWFTEVISPMLKATAKTFFLHGYKHGKTDEQKAVLERILKMPRQFRPSKKSS